MFYDSDEDTIVALSTPSGKGAIALVRISGLQALPIINKIFSPPLSWTIIGKQSLEPSISSMIRKSLTSVW